ncbi:aminoglycoside phosphotransferase family protein [Streptomyces sp. NPDC026672]|uniref:aminoglycoside phosphotransferase family protein n=1 Tax=unclassified Streptomyces TaxID=2593676 RepID=UPI0033CBEB63
MRHETAILPDRGRYPDVITPWEGTDWRRAALGWAEGELAARGLRVTGPPRVRLRPWSVLARLPVEGPGAVWFKANPPASAFEGALTAFLARRVPGHVLAPLAVDPARGWLLLPDGGDLFRDVLDREPPGVRAWEELLRQYARVQHAVAPHGREIEALGVPGARTAELPRLFDRLVESNTALAPGERARLAALRPRLADWCARLAAVGVPDTLDHADLHEGQVFRPAPGRFVFFDWGDALVTHPFCSLPVPAARAAERHGSEVLPRLRDAYLEVWTGAGHTAKELRRAVRPAWRLGVLGRAGAWGRLFPSATVGTPDDAGAADAARSLLRLFDEPPL